ncbi:methylenetetrahydrofolate reductase [Arthrobacter sp. B3I4]|uniref:methylenetetrahydrofolate reductase n=1 Tax=Arthrobacter sp. B3I4 TaxID=3042267 RepID=UPI002788E476|nr:methylenetetrahydrofolate reductase [Arthrobacter sp. B3I4]MDQ0756276.1 methylenetetrahydrofolate reductase (NADPH) [Arthrobacter sp. B3I4]
MTVHSPAPIFGPASTLPSPRDAGPGDPIPARLEIIPADGIVGRVHASIPPGSALTVTCLPHRGVRPTVQTALQLRGLGYDVVPHVAARSVESRAELTGILRECEGGGITEIFAVGGDMARTDGPYASSALILEDIAQISAGRIAVGVAGYPEEHPHQSQLHMLDALLEKQHLAASVVTQMCFSAARIGWYVELLRREGVTLPVWAGVAGSVPRAKLIAQATRIGVGPSLRFISRRGPLARRFLEGGNYSPRRLVSELSVFQPALAGVHLYTFNNLEPYSSAGPSVRATPAAAPARGRGR